MTGNAMSASPVGEPMLFKTPEAAAEALLAAFKNNDQGALTALFGAEYATGCSRRTRRPPVRAGSGYIRPPKSR